MSENSQLGFATGPLSISGDWRKGAEVQGNGLKIQENWGGEKHRRVNGKGKREDWVLTMEVVFLREKFWSYLKI